MSLRFGVISAYPRMDWHSRRIIRACARAGEVEVFAPTSFTLRVGARGAATVLAGGRDARRIQVWLLPRALGRHGDPDFQVGVYRALAELGLTLVNPVDALLAAEDKPATSWRLARAGIATPAVRAVQSLRDAEAALGELGPAVAKPPYGSLGIDVEPLRPGRAARQRLSRLLARYGLVYLQAQFGRGGEDLRLFVIGDRVAAAIRRTAARGAFAANEGQGGRLEPIAPLPRLARLAVRAARALGLEYAGVDLIDGTGAPTVLEVNGAPRWRGILAASGRDMADEIVAHASARACSQPQPEGDDRCGRPQPRRRAE
jgi:tetrahydromethanopterin:alpha-L-glutamate ligase